MLLQCILWFDLTFVDAVKMKKINKKWRRRENEKINPAIELQSGTKTYLVSLMWLLNFSDVAFVRRTEAWFFRRFESYKRAKIKRYF